MLKPHTNATAKPPKGSKGKASGIRQLNLWEGRVTAPFREREIIPGITRHDVDWDCPESLAALLLVARTLDLQKEMEERRQRSIEVPEVDVIQ